MSVASSGAQDPAAAISLRGVGLVYEQRRGQFPVLADIDLDIGRNEIVCVIGASGCGKSTLLNIVAGFIPPTRGEVLVEGKPVLRPGPDRGMVFQEDAIFPWYTVRRNVEYGLRAAGISGDERAERVRSLLKLVGLDTFAEVYPRELSGGMRKRCDIARALALKPPVLLLDEPFAALDVMTKERLQVEFLELWSEQPMTVLFVTHDIEEALFVGDRVAIMTAGPGPLKELVDLDYPRPRALELKSTPQFQQLRADLAHAIGRWEG